jgi:anti-anti-sigma factor
MTMDLTDRGAFAVQVEKRVDATVMRIHGELDIASVEAFRWEMLQGIDGKSVVIDLRGLTFLDSMGLCALIELARTTPRPVTLIRGPANVHRVFELTDTEARLEWLDPSGVEARG